jgi:hypothetical protein
MINMSYSLVHQALDSAATWVIHLTQFWYQLEKEPYDETKQEVIKGLKEE